MVGSLPVRIVAGAVARHYQRVVESSVEQAFVGFVALHFDAAERTFPFSFGEFGYAIDILVLKFEVSVFAGTVDAAERYSYADIDDRLADIDTGVEFFTSAVDDADFAVRIVDVHGEIYLVRLFASETSGIFAPARQH